MNGTIASLTPAFVEVVRQGSFTKAAEAMQLPKSTVSRHVSRLEHELGAQLLVRTTRTLRLTEAGDLFYARAAAALESMEEAVRTLGDHHGQPRGTLRITAPNDVTAILRPELLVRFTERYPDLRVELSLTSRRVDLVGEGFDCAIRAGTLADSSLIARKLASSSLRIFASPRFLEREGEPRTVEELERLPWVLFRPQQGVNRWRLEGPDGPCTLEVRGPLAVDDMGVARELVAAGGGVGLLPTSPLRADSPSLRCLMPELAAPRAAIHFVYPPARHVPAKVRALRDFLVEELGDEGARAQR